MAESAKCTKKKHVPGVDLHDEDILDFPFVTDPETIAFIQNHGHLMFIVRGPPGTGKSWLKDILLEAYPNAVCHSADQYFNLQFNPVPHNRENLRKSHEYCQRKIEEACIKKCHPVIVENTHMKKSELQPYMDFAAKYNYTVIMAITLRKFEASPEILEKSNKQGLDKGYFEYRLKQWQEVPPILTGWFIRPCDASYLFWHAQSLIKIIAETEGFCDNFNLSKGDKFDFRQRKMIYCVAAFSYYLQDRDFKKYYLSDMVQDCYGQCYSNELFGYLVTPSEIMAVVPISDSMRPLVSAEAARENFVLGYFNGTVLEYFKAIPPCDQESPELSDTIKLCTWEKGDIINTNNCSFIHLAQCDDVVYDVNCMKKRFASLLLEFADLDGNICDHQYSQMGNIKVAWLPGKACLIKPPKKLVITTVFTGLYK